MYGSGWKCDRGYHKSGNKCVQVKVPDNASIDMYGSGWKCDRGYHKSGNKCVQVKVPKNASIDLYGNGWKCDKGFKRSGNSCTAMTQKELRRHREKKELQSLRYNAEERRA